MPYRLFAWLLTGSMSFIVQPARSQDWPGWGGALVGNQRAAVGETVVNTTSVTHLRQAWKFKAHGNITATPTIQGGRLYFTDDYGAVFSLDAKTGQQIWMHWMSEYTGHVSSNSRSSPAIAGNLVIVADRRSGNVVGLDNTTGNAVWTTMVDPNPYVTLTASPVVYDGTVFIGTSSNEEYEVSVSASYVPTFRGGLTALDAATGKVKWQTAIVPAGYTGGAVWGSGFAISPARNLIYVATGNNYTVPQSVTNCIAAASGNLTKQGCLAKTDYIDAIVAVDLTSGAVRWGRRLQGLDTFNLNCISSQPAQPCPVPAGHDYDFGSAPNMLAATVGGMATDLVGAGQKSGVYWALKPDTGMLAWATRPAPGGVRGGILWGSAVDANQVYVAENDANHLPYKLLPGGTVRATGGSWAAIDSATGRVVWQTASPGAAPGQPKVPAGAEGAMTVANGVVFGGSSGGAMVAMDAASGRVLWQFQSGSSVTCGPSVSNGMVFWGTGDPYGTPGNTLYAFTTTPAG